MLFHSSSDYVCVLVDCMYGCVCTTRQRVGLVIVCDAARNVGQMTYSAHDGANGHSLLPYVPASVVGPIIDLAFKALSACGAQLHDTVVMQELVGLGFQEFYLELARELIACKAYVAQHPHSDFLVRKGTRMQEIEKLSNESLVTEAWHAMCRDSAQTNTHELNERITCVLYWRLLASTVDAVSHASYARTAPSGESAWSADAQVPQLQLVPQ